MQGDEQVLEFLNEVLTGEVAAINKFGEAQEVAQQIRG